MTLISVKHWSKQIFLAVMGGLLLAALIFGVFRVVFHYTAPAHDRTSTIALLHPIVDEYWIKIPVDIQRDRECPANGTMTLRRQNDYGDVLGVREDTIVVGLANTNLSGLGHTALMLWFPRPQHLAPGSWSFDAKVSDDCGGVGDIFNYSLANPRTLLVPNVLAVPREISP